MKHLNQSQIDSLFDKARNSRKEPVVNKPEDITKRSTGELSLLVFNDQGLYRLRHTVNFIELLMEYYLFTPAQLKVLRHDLAEDKKELEQ